MDAIKTVIDLFSGAGGFSLAATNQEMEILAAVEYDKESCSTYQYNFIDKKNSTARLYQNDILELDPESILKDISLEAGELDLLIGGPPCQGFSSHRLKGQGVNDPRNKLLIRYFDYLQAFQPKMFLVENVPGLLWKHHEFYLSKFMKLARESGYTVYDPQIVNAKDYGVPQNRRRVFILGVRDDIESKSLIWPPKQTHFAPNEEKISWVTASTVFESPPKDIRAKLEKIIGEDSCEKMVFGESVKSLKDDPSAIHMNHTKELTARFKDTPINGSRDDAPDKYILPCHQNGYKGHKDVYGRIKLNSPGPTITTGCNNPSKGRFVHPWKHHGITIRHAARFQTFPDDFVFCGGSISQAKQVGNAVPIKLGEVMIKEALKSLQFFNSQRETVKKTA